MSDALVLQSLRKVFKSDLLKKPQVALDGLSCRFPKGKVTGLLGHNGAGKTTAIRLVLGLVRPDQGVALAFGAPLGIEARRRLGYMPEVNKLPAALTPAEILTRHLALFRPKGLESRAERRAAVEQSLAAVGLAGHAKKRIGHLSKGMARRLAWAQAVVHRPELLILDEPASGLDPAGRREMLRWIDEEKARGTSIVLCTHELSQVKQLCDELHILKQGRLVLSSLPVEGGTTGVAHLARATRHVVHVSGAEEPALTKVMIDAAGQLPPWSGLAKDGFLSILSFASHAQAMAWIGALTQRGFLVVRYADETFAPDEELLPYFTVGGPA